MNISHPHIIEKLGGITAVAKRLVIKPPSVSGWIEDGKNGIPDGRLIELGAEIEAVTEYRRWDLRPKDWFVIWPELVGTKGAPKVPAAEVSAPLQNIPDNGLRRRKTDFVGEDAEAQ